MSLDAFRLWALPILARHGITEPRDSDASLAEDPKGLSGEAVAARAVGIAPKPLKSGQSS